MFIHFGTYAQWGGEYTVIELSITAPHNVAVDKTTVSLQAGQQHAIRVDYTDRAGEGYLKLL